MTFSEAIDDYRTGARHELGHSQATYYSYIASLKQFARWLEAGGHTDPAVGAITPALLRRYYHTLSRTGLRPRTIRGKLNALRALFGYLAAQGVIPENPTLTINMPKLDAAQRLLVSDDDLEKLLEAAERQRTDFRCVRDRAMLAVLIFGGLRRAELLGLEVPHLNVEDGVLLVQQGKGKKARAIPLCPEAVAMLRDWRAIREGLKCRHSFLFVNEGRRRVGEQGLARMLEEIKAIAGPDSHERLPSSPSSRLALPEASRSTSRSRSRSVAAMVWLDWPLAWSAACTKRRYRFVWSAGSGTWTTRKVPTLPAASRRTAC